MRPGPALVALGLWLQGHAVIAAEPADPECARLKTVVAAAAEKPSFRSMASARTMSLLGFSECEILDMSEDGHHPTFVCSDDQRDALSRWTRLNAEISRCLPNARRFADPGADNNMPPGRYAHFRVGRVRIDLWYQAFEDRFVSLFVEKRK